MTITAWKGRVLTARSPWLVIARGARTLAKRQRRASRPQCARCAGQIRPVRFLPCTGFVIFVCRRHVDGVMKPSMPGWRHVGRLRVAIINDPTPFHEKRPVDLAAAGPVIAIPEFIFADKLPVEPRPQLRAERVPVPPGKDQLEE